MKISDNLNAVYLNKQPHNNAVKAKSPPLQLKTGNEMIRQLGTPVLGAENIQNWESKGLKIPYEVYKKAFDTLNEALNWGNKQDSPQNTSFSFNAHGIVASVQQVPEWFLEEGKRYNQELPAVVQQAFEQNQLWFGHLNKIAV